MSIRRILSIQVRAAQSRTRLLKDRNGCPRITEAHRLSMTSARTEQEVHARDRRDTRSLMKECAMVPLEPHAESSEMGDGNECNRNPSLLTRSERISAVDEPQSTRARQK